jgi:CRP/FNR family transcriptional regulator
MMIEILQPIAAVSHRLVPGAISFADGSAIRVRPERADPLASLATRVTFRSHDTIVHEGDDAEWLFRIRDGIVKLQRILSDGRCQIVGLLFAGDFLGLAGEAAAPYSAYAVGSVSADRFSRQAMEQLCASSIPAARLLLHWANKELAAAQEQMLLLGCKTPREKFASFLLRLIRRQDNTDLIRLPMTRTDIADYLGLTLETVSRTMSQFRRDGLIEPLDRSAVRIVDLPTIEYLADCAEAPRDRRLSEGRSRSWETRVSVR